MAVVAGLHFGKELLVPFALALLLSFLLSGPVGWLQRIGLKKVGAVSLVFIAASGVAIGLAWLGAQELTGIVASLPQYRANMLHKLQSVRNPAGFGLTKLIESVESVKNVAATSKQPAQHPVPVRVISPAENIPTVGPFGTSLLTALASAFAVAVLTIFLLLNREHLRNRLFRLMGQGRLLAMTTALDDAAQRVSRYLLTQSLVNSTFGALWGLGLFAIGVPYAAFWGVAAAMLRFIPYLGTFVAGVCPVLLASIALTGWRRPLVTAALYIALEGLVSSIVEPWLYATRTGISSLAILLSAAFWTLLWGPIGLILSTPLTVCLAVIGRHIPALEFLYVLLGDEPALSEDVRYYQRLLAQDEDEAAEVLEESLKEMTRVEVFDKVVIPALGLAERDRHAGELEPSRAEYVLSATRDLLDEFSENNGQSEVSGHSLKIACVPSRDEADATVNLMLAHSLRAAGFDPRVFGLPRRPDDLVEINKGQFDVLIISALPPLALIPARSLCRKLRKSNRKIKIVLGVWNSDIPASEIEKRLGDACSDSVVVSISGAVERMKTLEVNEAAHAGV